MGEDGTTYASNARRRCLGALEPVVRVSTASDGSGIQERSFYERSCHRVHRADTHW